MHYFGPFWDNLIADWDHVSVTDRNTAALQWWLDQPGTYMCEWDLPGVVGNHLRLRTGARCFERIVAMFEAWVAEGGRPVLARLDTLCQWRRG